MRSKDTRSGASIENWARRQPDRIEWPELPPGVEDRDADVWESLIAVADMAGGDWPERARAAAVALVSAAKEAEPSLGVRLLADTRIAFGDAEQLTTVALIHALREMPESPWNDLKGRPLDERRLASTLRQYGIKSRSIESVVLLREDIAARTSSMRGSDTSSH